MGKHTKVNEIIKPVLISIISALIISFGGYILIVKENQLNIDFLKSELGSMKVDLKRIAEKVEAIDDKQRRDITDFNQISSQISGLSDLIKTMDQKIDYQGKEFKELRKDFNGLIMVVSNRHPEIDINTYLRLMSLKNLTSSQTLELASAIKKQQEIIRNSPPEKRLELAKDFVKKYHILETDYAIIYESFFNIKYGVGGPN